MKSRLGSTWAPQGAPAGMAWRGIVTVAPGAGAPWHHAVQRRENAAAGRYGARGGIDGAAIAVAGTASRRMNSAGLTLS